MKLFRNNNMRFNKPDPLDDGLRDAIAAERDEADAFNTLDDISGEELTNHWNAIVKDIEKDPSWFDFSKD